MSYSLNQVSTLVEAAYSESEIEFGRWIWRYHVPLVAEQAQILAQRHGARPELAVAGAWLHDFGDAFVDRFDPDFDQIATQKSLEVLQQAGYSAQDSKTVLEKVIAPHSCKPDQPQPQTLEAKVLATADAVAHLTTDFYIQFCWRNMPEGYDYPQFIDWVHEKLDRDFERKIFFEEVKTVVEPRYRALKAAFTSS